MLARSATLATLANRLATLANTSVTLANVVWGPVFVPMQAYSVLVSALVFVPMQASSVLVSALAFVPMQTYSVLVCVRFRTQVLLLFGVLLRRSYVFPKICPVV